MESLLNSFLFTLIFFSPLILLGVAYMLSDYYKRFYIAQKKSLQPWLKESILGDEVCMMHYKGGYITTTLFAFDGRRFILTITKAQALTNFIFFVNSDNNITRNDTELIIPIDYEGEFSFQFLSVEKRREEKALREAEILAQTVKDCNILPNNTDL